MAKIEKLQDIKRRRDGVLTGLVGRIPYLRFMNITFERRGDELTATMHYQDKLIGNPILPALHGGATASFLESTALIELSWLRAWELMEEGKLTPEQAEAGEFPMPKTIDLTVDYLRSGLPRDCYARARVNRAGRRFASVHVEAWQDNRDKLYAQATGHFLMPARDD